MRHTIDMYKSTCKKNKSVAFEKLGPPHFTIEETLVGEKVRYVQSLVFHLLASLQKGSTSKQRAICIQYKELKHQIICTFSD